MTVFNQQNTHKGSDQHDGEVLLEAKGVSKSFGAEGKGSRSGKPKLVLDSIDLQIRSGEFVALLGPSGSGKSTLLRALAGLIHPTEGQVLFKGEPQYGTNPHLAIVFQSFALFPWLTVLQNVELGLEAQDLTHTQRLKRALAAIDTIGLDGFEDAYPKELSGGMRQRVGFARALVVEPELLFMDEPFSALDVLTAANLRKELISLWESRSIPTRAIVMVTHNIDDAVSMADRIIVLGANPGHIRIELPGLPRGMRSMASEAHTGMVDLIYRIMTSPKTDVGSLLSKYSPTLILDGVQRNESTTVPEPRQLPHAAIGDVTGLIELVHARGDKVDLYQIGRELQLEFDELQPLLEAVDLLGLAEAQEGDLVLTQVGRRFAEANVLEEKQIFRQQVLERVPFLRQILQVLETTPGHSMPEEYVLSLLENHLNEEQAIEQLERLVDWGRYAELFTYIEDRGIFRLGEPEAVQQG
ncbi:ABC transporter ATP-binding protein [Tengunoibacter tsumagoiensis]|uniref:Nitrate ABC transporter ATP-binding protein n=1 Tax=Tengunoibacter tsumagoiensis TaxID=2014871 RepID=A0A402AAK7_9CHLR|nr:nitrate/sulfonate/bicarbonate ABC transporter ATP-binding protein [Tengunoibacter tsumagoiensis]GCE15985.1 nitrate ABC transporter ATP-binding protein [Tengunoibacter tsumagoiensis]